MANGNMQGMGMMAPPAQPMQEQASMPVVDMNSFQQSFSNLSDESNKVLEQHLTPPLKKVFAELFNCSELKSTDWYKAAKLSIEIRLLV